MQDKLVIQGARQHNLRDLNLEIPKNCFVVMTGVSGSGKSSLAFDTIYAEGQRRYVESLSSYARQFLGLMDKPDLDKIEGLSPSISIDQKTVSHNPRSTVGTTTEIYDYLRILFARLGTPHCPHCNLSIAKLSRDEIVAKLLTELSLAASSSPTSFRLLSPLVRGQKGEFRELIQNLVSKGYRQAVIDGKVYDLTQDFTLLKTNKHDLAAVVDQFVLTQKDLRAPEAWRSRLATAVEQATSLSLGLITLETPTASFLYSEHLACPQCGFSLSELEPRLFSFNSPLGACSTCKGLGTIERIEPQRLYKPHLSFNAGGITPLAYLLPHDTWYMRLIRTVAEAEGIDLSCPLGELPSAKLAVLLSGNNNSYRVRGTNTSGKLTHITETWTGIVHHLEEKYFGTDSEWARASLSKYIVTETCPLCQGKKLKPEVLAVTLDGFSIIDLTELSVTDLLDYMVTTLPSKLSPYAKQVGEGVLREVTTRLRFLVNVGLGYLTLARYSKSLSGGEQQRIRLASQIGTGLTGVLYVLDEPSIGLHPRDVAALIQTLRQLVALGNTLLVVEHDEETIRSADHLVELGPLAGTHGGRLVAQGTLAQVMANPNSLTGQYLSGKRSIPTSPPPLKKHQGTLKLLGARTNNLRRLDLTLPLGNLIGITGVSGSGKSSLLTDTLYPALKYHLTGSFQGKLGTYDRLDGYHYLSAVDLVDQSPIGRTPRSNPTTYVGLFDEIRSLFASTPDARLAGFAKGRFSFNLKGGRCEKCQGGGVIKVEMQFLPDVYVTCDLCKGQRYNQDTLAVKYKDLSIYQVLELTINEAAVFFARHHHLSRRLKYLQEVGLGYLKLGQPAPTLSGGEAQRVKLAAELGRRQDKNILYLLDEPTTGLHFYDVEHLLTTLKRLVAAGNTVVVIEHNLDVVKNCNYLVDLGPEGGDAGGKILYQGPTAGILKVKGSHTAKYLAKYR